MKFAAVAALSIALASSAAAQPRWRDTFQSRLEILALMETLNAELLASTSATRTLESWCGEHRMAREPKVIAVRIAAPSKPPLPELLQRLGVRDASELAYRRVELRCGARVMSVADNWYVPARLAPEMRAQLATTDTPFGKAVQALHPYRRTISVRMLWTPLPDGWELQPPPRSHPSRALTVPPDLFEHRAVLCTAENQPFSEVVETYRADVLAFGSE